MKTPEAMFASAIEFEQDGDPTSAALLYEEILKAGKDARAAVNLGTIHFQRKEYGRAVELYRQATEMAPGYALAFSNLGNALEEMKMPGCIKAYMEAIRLDPRCADAHYNLALALDQKGEPRRAIKHWRAYVKLDPDSPWSDHARHTIRETISIDCLSIVWRRSA